MITISRAHKIKLDLNPEQLAYCAKSAGVARFAYNWALAQWNFQYQQFKDGTLDKAPSEGELRKLFNQHKKLDVPAYFLVLSPEYQKNYFPWVTEVSKYCPQEAIRNLGKAFAKFFKGTSKYPQFKKRGVHDSFYLGNDAVKILEQDNQQYLKVPNLKEPLLLREKLRFKGKINNVVISREANKWFASISMETQAPLKVSPNVDCGIDLGIKTLATIVDSNGNVTSFANPKGYRKHLNRLKRLQRSLARKKKSSCNRRKAQMKVARLHAHIKNIRKDNLHKLTTHIVTNFKHIYVEDLNVSGMLKNRKLSQSIADLGISELKRQLQYKAEMTASTIHEVDRFFPSSQLCSKCGTQNRELKLSERQWKCEFCGETHDRDENAAKNLLNYKRFKKNLVPRETGELTLMKRNHFSRVRWTIEKPLVEVRKTEIQSSE